MNHIKLVTSFVLLSALTACAHHNNVRQSASGEHYVKLTAETRESAADEALSQAKHYCSEQNMKAYIVNETIQYQGSMAESDYLQQRNIANAIETAGTVLWVFGQNSVDDVGAAMSIGGGIAEDSMGEPYELEMAFTCR